MDAQHDVAVGTSLYDEAVREAERHKWIESQKRGRDLGELAIREWYQVHWPRYCRFRRMEHLHGRQRWREFDEDHFGRLCDLLTSADSLVKWVLDGVHQGLENLEILNRAIDQGLETERVIEILAAIDVNRARLDPIVI